MKLFQNWTQFPEEGSWRDAGGGTELKEKKRKKEIIPAFTYFCTLTHVVV